MSLETKGAENFVFYIDNKKYIATEMYVNNVNRPVAGIYYTNNSAPVCIWKREEQVTPEGFDSTCTIVLTANTSAITWKINVYKNYGTEEQVDLTSSIKSSSIWIYDVESGVRITPAFTIPCEGQPFANVVYLESITTAGGTYKFDVSRVTSKADESFIPSRGAQSCTEYLTIPVTCETKKYESGKMIAAKFIPSVDTVVNSYSFYTTSNDQMSSACKYIAHKDTTSTREGSGIYQCIATYDVTVIATDWTDSDGNTIYQYKCTLTDPVTLTAGEEYVFNGAISQWGSANYVEGTNKFNATECPVTIFEGYSIKSTVGTYFEEYGTITETTDTFTICLNI